MNCDDEPSALPGAAWLLAHKVAPAPWLVRQARATRGARQCFLKRRVRARAASAT